MPCLGSPRATEGNWDLKGENVSMVTISFPAHTKN